MKAGAMNLKAVGDRTCRWLERSARRLQFKPNIQINGGTNRVEYAVVDAQLCVSGHPRGIRDADEDTLGRPPLWLQLLQANR